MEFKDATKMDTKDVKLEMNSILKTIKILEWDKSRQQINPAKADKLVLLKKRYDELESTFNPDQPITNETF
jgi:hypothetical protein